MRSVASRLALNVIKENVCGLPVWKARMSHLLFICFIIMDYADATIAVVRTDTSLCKMLG
jgi:hypothetical protein